jgi:NAD(P)-dependent dehydrogenase (short-subunit alcohol dehydrogenase family)
MSVADQPLAGQVAVVTGAARGIGAALAERLARAGAHVALLGLEPDLLAETAARLPGDASPWQVDVTDEKALLAAAAGVAERYGRTDLVIANAGLGSGGWFAETPAAEHSRVIEVNLLGSIATARAFLPALRQSRGYLLQIASAAALVPSPLMTAYCASKSGVEAYAHALRGELAGDGVGVGVAYLSWTDTDMVRTADEDPFLRDLRAKLPWPANRTGALDPAADRLMAGILRRAPHVYGQPWVRALQWLPRGLVPAASARRSAKLLAQRRPV